MVKLKTMNVCCFLCGSAQSSIVGSAMDFEYKCCENEFVFVECEHCGLVYMKNQPDVSALPVIYSGDYDTYNYNEYLGSFISWIRSIQQRMKITHIKKYANLNATIVDIGCGGGELLRLVKKYGDLSWNLIGVDIADQAMNSLKNFGIEGRQGRFEAIDWSDVSPQILVMNQFIEHVENPDEVVENAFDILTPDGYLIIETPSVDAWDYFLFKKRYWGGWHTPKHWNLFKRQTLERLLTKHHFKIEEVSYTLNPYTWLHSFKFLCKEKYNLPRISNLFQVNVFPALVMASLIDVFQKAIRKKTSNIRIIAKKV